MNGSTHAVVNACFALILGVDFGMLWLVVAGALLPDIDHPNSLIGSFLKPVSRRLHVLLSHRGFTHSLALLIPLLLVGLRFEFLWVLALSWLGHVLLDMLTRTGVKLLWPYHKRFIILGGKLRTGSWHDLGVTVLSIGLVLWRFYS